MDLPYARRSEIDSLAQTLSAPRTLGELESIAHGQGIKTLISGKVIIPCMLEYEGKPHIISRRFLFERNTNYSFAHELGHAIMGSDREDEVDYFANALGFQTPSVPHLLLESVYIMATRPFSFFLYQIPFVSNNYRTWHVTRLARKAK